MNNVNREQVKACKDWLSIWVTPIKNINKKFGSYRLKHVVEDSDFGKICHGYVSEESFIEAAKQLGYIFKDGFFNMSFKKIMVSPEQYQAFYGGALKESNKNGRIKWNKKKGYKRK